MEIKVLGVGCASCRKLYEHTREVIEEKCLDATLTKVENIAEILSYGAAAMPALVINGVLAIEGRVASKEEIRILLD